MIDFRTGAIFSLLARTLPFVVLRVAVYVGIALLYVLAIGIGGGLGYLFGHIGGTSGGGGALGGLIGFGIVSGLLYWAREYLLYLVKAGHVAVLVQLIDGHDIPGGQGQIDYARGVVKQHFATSSMLFGLNQLLRGILRVFNRLTVSIAAWLPIPGLELVVRLIDAIINTALRHLDQVILAQILRRSGSDAWSVACDSVVLYAQNCKAVLRNAAFLTFIVWGLTLLLFALAAAPIAALMGVFHIHPGALTIAATLIVALSLKAAFIDPFATVALLQVFDAVTRGQTPDAQWRSKLEQTSSGFRELAQKARGAANTQASPPLGTR